MTLLTLDGLVTDICITVLGQKILSTLHVPTFGEDPCRYEFVVIHFLVMFNQIANRAYMQLFKEVIKIACFSYSDLNLLLFLYHYICFKLVNIQIRISKLYLKYKNWNLMVFIINLFIEIEN